MKKIIRCFAIVAAILTVAACTNEAEESPVSFSREMTFTATREDVSPDTKTVRMDDGSTWWNASEEISVFHGSGSGGGDKLTSQNTTLQEIVEFSGSVTFTGSGKEYWAVYPYSQDNACDGTSVTTVIPDTQTGSEGNFAGDVFPAIAKSKTMDLAFWNICGGIKFFVSRSDIKSVTFKGNNDETLAGKVRVSFNADGKPEVSEVLDGKTEVTLNAPENGTFKAGKYYYMTLLPAALNGGFIMTFNTATEAGSVVSNKAQTVKRSIFGVLKNIDSKVSEWKSTWVEPEYVDLGLSVRWATFNIGATKPEEYGDYFAWGETETKTNYNWSTYKWCNGDGNKATKYCTDSIIWDSTEPMDNKTVLDPEDDAAFANWGGNWRMPTYADLLELCYNCTWTWTEQNGVKGSIVTGSNGNSIFLPAAGTMDDTNLKFAGEHGVYWSSSLDTNFPRCAWFVVFYSNQAYENYFIRSEGHTVRAVYDDRVYPESVFLNKSTLTLYVGDSEQLTPTVLPENASVKSVEWSSDNREVVTVYKGVVTAYKAGTATITATTTLGAKTAICKVTVVEPPKLEAVNLGLPSGLKWASWNVGADAPEKYGDHFAWGETQPKEDYSWSTYKWCNGAYSKLTKYCTNSSYWDSTEPMDNKTRLDLEDDAARANWGACWRIATDSEWSELLNYCTSTWTTQNGVKGRLVTGSNGNSIFLPAAGYRYDTSLSLVGFLCDYWSSSLLSKSSSNSWYVFFRSDEVRSTYDGRYYGRSVRPVYDDRIHPKSVSINKTTLSLIVGDSERLTATVLPSDATDRSVTWSSDNTEVATVDNEGNVKALAAGTAKITATTTLGGLTATCEVTVGIPMPEAVDLGTGVKWASFNIGATKPEEYGDYFAWGETEPYYSVLNPLTWKDGKTGYNWASYKWCNGSANSITKYNNKSSYGIVDNKSELDPEDDVAHVKLGGKWRMPGDGDWQSLRSGCTWTWVSQSGVYGYLVTGSNGNSIFLPAAGYLSNSYSNGKGSFGNYWTSTLHSSSPGDAYSADFDSNNIERTDDQYRYNGRTVRAVTE